jgi:hypothetical protein
MKPYDGAEKDGPLGFFKGVGKGIGGVICKPLLVCIRSAVSSSILFHLLIFVQAL